MELEQWWWVQRWVLQQEQQRLHWMEEEYARGQQEHTQNQEELLFALQALGYASIAEAEMACLDPIEAEELNQQDQQLNQRPAETSVCLSRCFVLHVLYSLVTPNNA